jgi:hypothetical protein
MTGAGGLTHPSTPESVYARGLSSQRQPRGSATGISPVGQLGPDARVHEPPDLKVQLDLPSLLLGARSIGPPHIEVGIACVLNDEARALEMSAQVIEEGEVAGS